MRPSAISCKTNGTTDRGVGRGGCQGHSFDVRFQTSSCWQTFCLMEEGITIFSLLTEKNVLGALSLFIVTSSWNTGVPPSSRGPLSWMLKISSKQNTPIKSTEVLPEWVSGLVDVKLSGKILRGSISQFLSALEYPVPESSAQGLSQKAITGNLISSEWEEITPSRSNVW